MTDSTATKGTAALPLSKRAVSVVDTRTRRGDPFAAKTAVAMTLARYGSSDPDTTPSTAIDLARKQDELVLLPKPGGDRACLTIRDKRRLAACAARFRDAGDEELAEACIDLVERDDVPRVLERSYVTGPP